VEHARQVALVGEAAAHGDRADAVVRSLQHFTGTVDPLTHKPAMGRRSHADLERSDEIAPRQAAFVREIRDGDVVAKVSVQYAQRELNLPRRKASGGNPLHFLAASHGRLLKASPDIQRQILQKYHFVQSIPGSAIR
jgi:hypothetical protein